MVDTNFQVGVSSNDLKIPANISIGMSPTRRIAPEPNNRNNMEANKDVSYQIMDNMDNLSRIIIVISEILGTGILVFVGCTGCLKWYKDYPPHLQASLTFGLAIMMGVQCFGHISGSHINPIVTVAAAILGHIPLYQVPLYIIGQIIGAFFGFGLLKAITPGDVVQEKGSAGVCSPDVNELISPGQAFLVEFIISLILILVVLSVWDRKNNNNQDSVPLRFGFTVAGLAMAAGPYTGAHMNPARSFAPAALNGDWKNHWIYWLAPLLASVLGTLSYKYFFEKKKDTEEEKHEDFSVASDKF